MDDIARDEPGRTGAVDLLADLFHYLDAIGEDRESVIQTARMHHGRER